MERSNAYFKMDLPEYQNMGTPVTEEKKRETPITVPSPPTCVF